MRQKLLAGTGLVLILGAFTALTAAQRVVVCEELYQEG
jgi:hypothetical protein